MRPPSQKRAKIIEPFFMNDKSDLLMDNQYNHKIHENLIIDDLYLSEI